MTVFGSSVNLSRVPLFPLFRWTNWLLALKIFPTLKGSGLAIKSKCQAINNHLYSGLTYFFPWLWASYNQPTSRGLPWNVLKGASRTSPTPSHPRQDASAARGSGALLAGPPASRTPGAGPWADSPPRSAQVLRLCWAWGEAGGPAQGCPSWAPGACSLQGCPQTRQSLRQWTGGRAGKAYAATWPPSYPKRNKEVTLPGTTVKLRKALWKKPAFLCILSRKRTSRTL